MAELTTPSFTYNTNAVIDNSLSSVPKEQKFYPYQFNYIGAIDKNNLSPCDNKAEVASRLIESAKSIHSYSACANQFGLNLNLFVAGSDDNFVAFFNPKVISIEGEKVEKEADLISDPGLILSVKRAKSITLQYDDFEGNSHTQKYDGLTARIIQQCLDRLEGKSFKDGVSKLKLERAEKALDKKMKQVIRYQMNQVKLQKKSA